ncbi:MAG: hypothetical protein ACYSU0_23105 [Planctomycetota bacterium]
MNEQIIRMLLGLGLDGGDGHFRITKGPNFHLFGGSEPTHERMQHTCMRFNEELQRRGKAINEVSPEEAREIIREIEARQ